MVLVTCLIGGCGLHDDKVYRKAAEGRTKIRLLSYTDGYGDSGGTTTHVRLLTWLDDPKAREVHQPGDEVRVVDPEFSEEVSAGNPPLGAVFDCATQLNEQVVFSSGWQVMLEDCRPDTSFPSGFPLQTTGEVTIKVTKADPRDPVAFTVESLRPNLPDLVGTKVRKSYGTAARRDIPDLKAGDLVRCRAEYRETRGNGVIPGDPLLQVTECRRVD